MFHIYKVKGSLSNKWLLMVMGINVSGNRRVKINEKNCYGKVILKNNKGLGAYIISYKKKVMAYHNNFFSRKGDINENI